MTTTTHLRDLLARATKGEWLVNPVTAWVELAGEDAPICAMLWPTDLRSEDETYANARLICAMREALPALLDRLDEAEKVIGDIASGEAFCEQRFAEDDDADYFLRAQRNVQRRAAAFLNPENES